MAGKHGSSGDIGSFLREFKPGPRLHRLPCSPHKTIWKSLPYSRLSDNCRTGVGHRRWVRKDTPALRPQTEQRPPSLSAPRSPCLSKLPPSSATRFAFALPPHRTAQPSAESGGRGGLSRLRRGIISDLAVPPKSTQVRLRKTHCTSCIACTTAAALNAGSEFRLRACRRPGS